MEIRNIRHKALRSFVETGRAKGLLAAHVTKLGDIIAFLIDTDSIDEVHDLQKYRPHMLTGSRSGTFSLRLSGNWRLTFRYDQDSNEIYDMDYEDYH